MPSNFENHSTSPGIEPGQTGWLGPGPAGRLFLRPPTLTAGNFSALWPTVPKFLALKDLNPFKTLSKVQKTGSILRVGFALSKWPHLHRAYVVRGSWHLTWWKIYALNQTFFYLPIENGQGMKYQVLAGPTFVVVFTVSGILMGYLADKSSR